MRIPHLSLSLTLLLLLPGIARLIKAESFYDNPEQDPLLPETPGPSGSELFGNGDVDVNGKLTPGQEGYAYEPGKVPKEELARLWDLEVCFCLSGGILQGTTIAICFYYL